LSKCLRDCPLKADVALCIRNVSNVLAVAPMSEAAAQTLPIMGYMAVKNADLKQLVTVFRCAPNLIG
jgi:hypothetical protein